MIAQPDQRRYAQIDPDVRLMLRAANNDDAAFTRLVEKYETPVRNLMSRLGTRSDSAPDLTQDVFLRVYRSRDRYVPTAHFSVWLWAIARNVAANSHRTSRRRIGEGIQSRAETESPPPVDPCREPGEELEWVEASARLHLAIHSLGQQQRTAIELAGLKQMSHVEVADTMGLTTMAVKSLLTRARANLRQRLEAYIEPQDR